MNKKSIRIAGISGGHVQGIATDRERKYMYFSFTTKLVKTDMEGNIVGSVTGLTGHLGCIAFNYDDGRLYGSLEYKHDRIGKSILERAERKTDVQDGFYVAVFDVDRIDREDMQAESDGIMKAVYLDEVLKDYAFEGHRYGCSGIDGLTFAPIPGSCGTKKYLYVSYGIYGDVSRNDNDYQVILRYNTDGWKSYEKPLDQNDMHRYGPASPDSKYFLYTGNTTYGIQNLEYDEHSGYMFAAVYRGKKECFPNYPMYVIDMQRPASFEKLNNINESGEVLHLAKVGITDTQTGIRGIEFPYGSTGMISLGDGGFFFSKNFSDANTYGTEIEVYRFDRSVGFVPQRHE